MSRSRRVSPPERSKNLKFTMKSVSKIPKTALMWWFFLHVQYRNVSELIQMCHGNTLGGHMTSAHQTSWSQSEAPLNLITIYNKTIFRTSIFFKVESLRKLWELWEL